MLSHVFLFLIWFGQFGRYGYGDLAWRNICGWPSSVSKLGTQTPYHRRGDKALNQTRGLSTALLLSTEVNPLPQAEAGWIQCTYFCSICSWAVTTPAPCPSEHLSSPPSPLPWVDLFHGGSWWKAREKECISDWIYNWRRRRNCQELKSRVNLTLGHHLVKYSVGWH